MGMVYHIWEGAMTDQKTINDIIDHLDRSGKREWADHLRGFVVHAGEWKKDAELYQSLKSMHWEQRKLSVVDSMTLRLGQQTYSGHLLDEAIRRANGEKS
jgi:hypothetical protein